MANFLRRFDSDKLTLLTCPQSKCMKVPSHQSYYGCSAKCRVGLTEVTELNLNNDSDVFSKKLNHSKSML